MIFWIRLLYNLLFPVVLVLLLPGFALRMIRRGKYRHKFWQRFAIYSEGVERKIADTGRVWVHALGINGKALPEFVAVFSTANHSQSESRQQ